MKEIAAIAGGQVKPSSLIKGNKSQVAEVSFADVAKTTLSSLPVAVMTKGSLDKSSLRRKEETGLNLFGQEDSEEDDLFGIIKSLEDRLKQLKEW